MITLNERTQTNIDSCLNIANDLKEFFNEEGIEKMKKDIVNNDIYICVEEAVKGFATVNQKNVSVAEITWIAVDRKLHKSGTGKEIVAYMCKDLREKGFKLLEVKTLSEVEDYEPYIKTRAFYQGCKFVLLETINPYPQWGPGNPCDIYVRIL